MIRIQTPLLLLVLSLLIENSYSIVKTTSSQNMIERRRDSRRRLQMKDDKDKEKKNNKHSDIQEKRSYDRFQNTTHDEKDDDYADTDTDDESTNDDNELIDDAVTTKSLESTLKNVSSSDDDGGDDDDNYSISTNDDDNDNDNKKKVSDDNIELSSNDISTMKSSIFDMLFKNPKMQPKLIEALEERGINAKIERMIDNIPTQSRAIVPTQFPRTPTLSRPIPPAVDDTPSSQPVVTDKKSSPSMCRPSSTTNSGMSKSTKPKSGMGQRNMKTGKGKGKNTSSNPTIPVPITICPEEPTILPSNSLFPTNKDKGTTAPAAVPILVAVPTNTPQRTKEEKKKMNSSKKEKCSTDGKMGMMGGKECKTVLPTKKPTKKPKLSITTIPSVQPTSTLFPTPATFPPTTKLEPSPSPSSEPSPSPICIPTSGTCSQDEIDLQESIRNATNGDIVAICDRAVFDVTEAITTKPEQSDLTICCNVGCTLTGTGNDSLMFLEGPSVTLFGISFINGRSTDFNGGNVGIETSGDVSVIKCNFRNGFSNETGGNLFVAMDNGGTVLIEDCTFENGSAIAAGGGVSVFDASLITVSNSIFTNNTALGTAEGGGFYANKNPTITDYEQDITIIGSTFTNNKARAGAGFLVFDLGTNATVQVTNNQFNDNTAVVAAAGGILSSLLQTNVFVNKNNGINNSGGICDGFLTFRTQNDGICIRIDESFNNTVT